jgi:hypothetical protein
LTPEYGWSISTIVLLDGIAEIFGLPKEEMVKMVTTDEWRRTHEPKATVRGYRSL